MGGNQSDNFNQFKQEDWQILQSTNGVRVWQNIRHPTQNIQEYELTPNNAQEISNQKNLYYLRKNNPQLVSSYFLQQQQSQFCSSAQRYRLFLQKIPIRLSDVEHIPSPDHLHLYSQVLQGFAQLVQHVGYFQVYDQYVGINEKGVAKVWLNPDFARSFVVSTRISEQTMVKNIIDMIESCIDQNKVPSVRNYLYNNTDSLTFNQAIQKFNSYTLLQINKTIPDKMDCINQVGGVYAIASRHNIPQPQIKQQAQPRPYQNLPPLPPKPFHNSNSMVSYRQNATRSQVRPIYPHYIDTPQFQNNLSKISQKSKSQISFNMNGSQVVPLTKREDFIINPNTIKSNTPIIRRRSDIQDFHKIGTSSVVQFPHVIRQQNNRYQGNNINIFQQSQVIHQVHKPQSSYAYSSNNQIVQKPLSNSGSRVIFKSNNIQHTQRSINQRPSIINGLMNSQQIVLQNNFKNNTQNVQKKSSKNSQIIIQIPNNNIVRNNPQSTVPIFLKRQQKIHQFTPTSIQPYRQINNNFNSYQPDFNPRQAISISNQTTTNLVSKQSLSYNNSLQFNESYDFKLKPRQVISFKNESYQNKLKLQGSKQVYQLQNVFQNNNKKSKVLQINLDDGKSSPDFLKQLSKISNNYQYQSSKTNKNEINNYQTNLYDNNFKKHHNYQFQNTYNIQNSKVSSQSRYLNHQIKEQNYLQKKQQFGGRNTISNIIQNNGQYRFSRQIIQTQPLQFQNNLQLKYSMMQGQQENFKRKSVIGKYQANLDPQLLADLHLSQ